jgi:hypothetical protein
MGLPKKPKVEAEIFGSRLQDEQVVHSINGEVLMLEWHHGREGRVVVPEPTLSTWLQMVELSRVQGDAWHRSARRWQLSRRQRMPILPPATRIRPTPARNAGNRRCG